METKKPVNHRYSYIEHVENVARPFLYHFGAFGVFRYRVGDRGCERWPSPCPIPARREQHVGARTLLQENTVSEKRFRDSFVPDAQRTRIVSSFLFSYQDAVELNATGQFLHNTLPTSQEGTVNTYVLLLLLFETQNIIETNLNYLYERLLFLFFFSC